MSTLAHAIARATGAALWLATLLILCAAMLFVALQVRNAVVRRRRQRGASGAEQSKPEGESWVGVSATLASDAACRACACATRFALSVLRMQSQPKEDDGSDSDIIKPSTLHRSMRFLDSRSGSAEESDDPMTPLSARHFRVVQMRRAMANANIRKRLDEVPADEMAGSFKVHACTWNVDQQPPPEYSTSFLTWLLGAELAQKVERYHEKRQVIMTSMLRPIPSSSRNIASQQPDAESSTLSSPHSPASPPAHPSGASLRLPPRRQHRSQATTASTQQDEQRRPASAQPLARDERQRREGAEEEAKASQTRRLARSDATLAQLLQEFPDLLVVALQEVDMGGVALVRESTTSSALWTDAIIEALHIAADRQLYYKRLKVVQLVGLMLIVLVQAKHADYISHVRLSLTRTGAMRVLGNKGSVAMRTTIYGKRFLFITAHFAAHKHNEERRMNNYHAALNDLHFDMPAFIDDESEVLRTFINANRNTASLIDSFVAGRSAWDRLFRVLKKPPPSADTESHVLDEHDYIFFLGDLNSRLHAVDGNEIRERIAQQDYDKLLTHDEVRQGMVYGEVFDGFEEQWIRFPPTYKFDRGTSTYDTSRKKRDPAWCDRVLFRVLDPTAQTWQPAEVGGTDEDADAQDAGPLPAMFSPTSNVGQDEGDRETAVERSIRSSSSSVPDAPAGEAAKGAGDDEEEHAGTGSAHRPRASATAGGALEESRSREWVAVGALKHLGFEESASIGDSSRFTQRTTEPDAAVPAAPLTTVENSMSILTARSVASPSSSTLTASSSAHTPSSKANQRKPTAPSSGADFYVPPSHPVWTQKRCEETFQAARRPFNFKENEIRFPMIPNHVNPLEYFCVEDLKQSDHRPVCARFEVKVIALKADLVSGILGDIQETIRTGIDSEDASPLWAQQHDNCATFLEERVATPTTATESHAATVSESAAAPQTDHAAGQASAPGGVPSTVAAEAEAPSVPPAATPCRKPRRHGADSHPSNSKGQQHAAPPPHATRPKRQLASGPGNVTITVPRTEPTEPSASAKKRN